MGEFNLKDLEKIYKQDEIMDFLIDHDIIKEKKFINQYHYEKQLSALQYDLVRLQAHLAESGKRVLMIFEGRDAAGKGGSIKRVVKNLNPKKYRVIALSKPTEKEQGQWYFQRYLQHLPNAGEMVFFDRSWYNRAVVEPVFGFCSPAEYDLFMDEVNAVEQRLVNDGIILIKFFLDISKEEQEERLNDRKEDDLKRWKLGPLDQQAQEKWDVYTQYIDAMLEKTATPELPWIVIETDDKKKARLEVIKYILKNIDGFEPEIDAEINEDIVAQKIGK